MTKKPKSKKASDQLRQSLRDKMNDYLLLIAIKEIEELLHNALLSDGSMDYAFYENVLAETTDSLKSSMNEDKEDYIFTLMANQKEGTVAMLLVEKSGNIYINEQARERLKVLWTVAYKNNMKMFIPDFAQIIAMGERPIYGMVIAKRSKKHKRFWQL